MVAWAVGMPEAMQPSENIDRAALANIVGYSAHVAGHWSTENSRTHQAKTANYQIEFVGTRKRLVHAVYRPTMASVTVRGVSLRVNQKQAGSACVCA